MFKKVLLSAALCFSLSQTIQASNDPHVHPFQGFEEGQLPASQLKVPFLNQIKIEASKLNSLPVEFRSNNLAIFGDLLEVGTSTKIIDMQMHPGALAPSFCIPGGFPIDANNLLLKVLTNNSIEVAYPDIENFGIVSGQVCAGDENQFDIGTWSETIGLEPRELVAKFVSARSMLHLNAVQQLCNMNKPLMQIISYALVAKRSTVNGKDINTTNIKEVLRFMDYAFGIKFEEAPSKDVTFKITVIGKRTHTLEKLKSNNRQNKMKIVKVLREILADLKKFGWTFDGEKKTFNYTFEQ